MIQEQHTESLSLYFFLIQVNSTAYSVYSNKVEVIHSFWTKSRLLTLFSTVRKLRKKRMRLLAVDSKRLAEDGYTWKSGPVNMAMVTYRVPTVFWKFWEIIWHFQGLENLWKMNHLTDFCIIIFFLHILWILISDKLVISSLTKLAGLLHILPVFCCCFSVLLLLFLFVCFFFFFFFMYNLNYTLQFRILISEL